MNLIQFSEYLTKLIRIQLVIGLLTGTLIHSQNQGLLVPQDSSTLPKSKTAIEFPERKAKISEDTRLIENSNGEFRIVSGWELIESGKIELSVEHITTSGLDTKAWYNATVPGTILTTLVDQGVYPDPYFGINNLAIPDTLCRQEWWYRNEFELPDGFENKRIWITFDGTNYVSDIWLNGSMLGKIKGVFIRGKFDATHIINPDGSNVLAVHIYPPPNPGIPHEESPLAGTGPNGGQLCKDGPTFISSEGWDWIPGIRDRNIGLWQDVSIKYTGPVTLEDPQVITDLPLPDTTKVFLTVRAEIINSSESPKNVIVKGTIGEIEFDKTILIPPFEQRMVEFSHEDFDQLIMDEPDLWWPNGYGKPNLYTLKLALYASDKIRSDSATVRFGVRELSYDLNVDSKAFKNRQIDYNPTKLLKAGKPIIDNLTKREVMPGTVIPRLYDEVDLSEIKDGHNPDSSPFLVVKVNGQRIYCKGGNWGMDDGMKRVSHERLEPYIRLQRDANFTMIRNWTGESTEKVFYELCDEYGLLVWNDFWLSTEGWNLEVDDNELFLMNAEDVIKRFRNHPSIAIWCARNEGYPIPELESGLAELVAEHDGTRLYHPNSRYLNLRPSGPWHYLDNPAEYYISRAEGFSTELGTPSVPTAETMRAMMAEEDVWPISDVWYYHDFHDGQEKYRQAINDLYGGPQETLEEFCMKAQMVNYESHRAMFESWNSKMWNAASGLLIWMSHPAWPSIVWQIYSSDYETHGAYYAAKKACEPVHIQMNLHNQVVTTINTTLNSYDDLTVLQELIDLNGYVLSSKEMELELPANSRKDLSKVKFTGNLPDVYFIRLKLVDDETLLSDNLYWQWNGGGVRNFNDLNKLENVDLTAGANYKLTDNLISIDINITNPSESIALMIKLNLRDSVTGERILPAYFSEGYFTLLPGESRQVVMDSTIDEVTNKLSITAEGYNIKRHSIWEMKVK